MSIHYPVFSYYRMCSLTIECVLLLRMCSTGIGRVMSIHYPDGTSTSIDAEPTVSAGGGGGGEGGGGQTDLNEDVQSAVE